MYALADQTSICSDNSLPSIQRHAIIWHNAG